jgi:hypothetical protein
MPGISIFAFFAILLSTPAWADPDSCPRDPLIDLRNRPVLFRVNKFTNYEPMRRGINGRCGRSATPGMDACQYMLDDHVKGNIDGAMAAVPQRGGNSYMYGGVFHAVALEEEGIRRQNGCLLLHMADRYGTGSNGMSKVDVVTWPFSKLAAPVNNASRLDRYGRVRADKSGLIELVGAVEHLRSLNSVRRIMRKQRAL